MHKGRGGETSEIVSSQPMSKRSPHPLSCIRALADGRQPFLCGPILEICREGFGLFPDLLNVREQLPPVLPGQALEAEETHHPLKGSREASRLIGHVAPIGELKLQWNGLIRRQQLWPVESEEESSRLLKTSQEIRCWVGWIQPESFGPFRMIEQRYVTVLSLQVVGGHETCQAGAENEDGVGGWISHETRERSQMRKAMISRCVVVRLIRGPKTW